MTDLTIGKLARASGVNIDTVRYYERLRLVSARRRSRAGYRLYDRETVGRIRFIRKTQALGFTLAQISQLLAFGTSPRATAGDVLDMMEAKIAEQKANIEHLRKIRAALLKVAKLCPGDGPVEYCPIFRYFQTQD